MIYPLFLPSDTYTLSSIVTSTDTDGNDCYFGIYDASNSLLVGARLTRNNRASYTFTLNSNSSYIIFYAGHNSNQSVGDDATWADVQIEFGQIASEYEPYNGHTYTIDLDGTRYGGTLDVVSGVLTVDREYVDLGTLDWALRPNTNNVFEADVTNIYVPKSAGERNKGMICSIYKLSSVTYLDDRMDDESMLRYGGKVLVRDTSYQDATTFKTAMNGVQLVYELETPQTYQLTPTQVNSLLGQNNVWADTGDVLDAEYIRDTTTIINSLIARIEALENQ